MDELFWTLVGKYKVPDRLHVINIASKSFFFILNKVIYIYITAYDQILISTIKWIKCGISFTYTMDKISSGCSINWQYTNIIKRMW